MARLASLALIVLCAAITAGCDDEESSPPVADTTSVAVYFLRDGKVSPVRRTIPATPAVARAAVTELLAGPTDDESAGGLASEIPADASLHDIAIEDGTATVDLDGAFAAGGDSASMQRRVAQIVATLTRFPTVDRVAFRVDGERVDTIGGVGVDPPLGRGAIEDETPQILVESPLPGDAVAAPVRLRGTANVYEATVSIRVRDDGGNVVLDTFTTATSGTGTRGTFDTELDVPTGSGDVTVMAYEASAEDGRPLHTVEVPLTVTR